MYDVRAQSLAASSGATDFGEYFTYFSTFLVVSALLLAGLFFKLGVEQRLQEVGLLQALGLDPAAIRRLFAGEALVLAGIGGIAGIAGAIGYSALIMLGLRTWWVDAVGTTALALHVDPVSLIAGAAAVVLIAIASIWWSLRALASASTRSLSAKGSRPSFYGKRKKPPDPFLLAVIAGVLAVRCSPAQRSAPCRGWPDSSAPARSRSSPCCGCRRPGCAGDAGARFTGTAHGPCGGSGGAIRHTDRREACCASRSSPLRPLSSLPSRRSNATNRPRCSIVIREVEDIRCWSRRSFPIVHDLNDASGRDAMNLPSGGALQDVRFDRFRVRPGEDASCLNLYQPKNPRIIAATQDFINSGRFAFHSSMAETPEERENPWLLLNRPLEDGVVPVIADANSMTYVLHMKLGDEFVLPGSSERPVRLRLVAALSDSIFQGELVMSEQPFVRLFPEWEGYRFFLADAPAGQAPAVTELLESRLSDFGVDVASTAERLAGFHRVEYTYLSTFQMLGGLGLVLGTLGLGAILLRNVLERRRELAVLRALGYTRRDFLTMVVAENVLLLVAGLADRHVLRAGRNRAGVSRSRWTIADRYAGPAARWRAGNRIARVAGRNGRSPAIAVAVGL